MFTCHAARLLAAALLSTTTMTVLVPFAQAQVDQRRSYDIAAGPLAEALNRFAEQSGIQLSYDATLTEGRASSGYKGVATVEAGLSGLLSGTGLGYRRNGDVVTIVAAPSTGSLMLDPVRVEEAASRGERPEATARALGEHGRSDIIVTALLPQTSSISGTKTDTPLIETPQSISVVNMDEMRVRNILSVSDAVAYSAGAFSGSKGNTYGGDAIALRGFGNDGTTGTAGNTYIDGLRLGGTGYLVSGLDPWLYERVEVVKGPASVLFGQSTPGGLINMVSKRPRAEAGGDIFLRYGSFDRKQIGIDVTGAVTDAENLLVRFAGTAFEGHDIYPFSDRQRVMVAPSLTWLIGEKTSLTLLGHYQHDDFAGSTLNWLPTIGTVIDNPNGQISRKLFTGDPNYQVWDRTTASIGYQFEHRFSDAFAVRQNFRYTHNDLDNRSIYINRLNADLRTATRQAFGLLETSNDYTIDTHADFKFATGPLQHALLVGFDWQKFENDTVREFVNAPVLDVFAPVYFQTIPPRAPFRDLANTSEQTGIYAQNQISLDGWRLLLGLRYDWAENGTTDRARGASLSEKSEALTKRIALLHLFENGLAPYVSYSDSFTPLGGTDIAGNRFDPERGKQIEAGLKYQPRGSASFVTASLFDLRRRNVLTPDPLNPNFSIQTGEIRVRGLELEANVQLAKGLKAIGSYTHLDPKVTKANGNVTGINPATLAVESRAQQGLRPMAVPRHNASLWLDYEVPQGIGLGAGVRHSSSTFGDAANLSKVPAYTLFDASIRFDVGRWANAFQGISLAVKANNVFDKSYVSSCVGIDRCYYGGARNVTIDLGYRW